MSVRLWINQQRKYTIVFFYSKISVLSLWLIKKISSYGTRVQIRLYLHVSQKMTFVLMKEQWHLGLDFLLVLSYNMRWGEVKWGKFVALSHSQRNISYIHVLFWCSVLLNLWSPKGCCCSISDDLSCSCRFAGGLKKKFRPSLICKFNGSMQYRAMQFYSEIPLSFITILLIIPYIGIFSRRAILAKMILGRCVYCSQSPIFDIWRVFNRDYLQCLFFAMFIFSDLEEVANSAKIEPTQKNSDIR